MEGRIWAWVAVKRLPEWVDILLYLPLVVLAALWRTVLWRTTIVAITGSVGKTTAKECLAAILATQGRTVKTRDSANGRSGVARTLLRIRPWHRFAVVEVGIERPGRMWRSALLVRPNVAVLLGVARTHTRSLRTLEITAREKAKLFDGLRSGGIAVLNASDPHVAPLAERVRRRTLTFGFGEGVDVRGRDARAAWPERLAFTVEAGGESRRVQTRLVGTHWAPAVLGAVAAAVACGTPLEAAARALETVEPFPGRMQPARLPNGAVFLRDEYNGSLDTFEAAVEVLRQARARRRILVISDCSDFPKSGRQRARHYVRAAKECAEMLIFVGERGEYGAGRARREGMPEGSVHAFYDIGAAARFLRKELRSGDLVLLRGRTEEHLTRLYYLQLGTVQCRKPACRLRFVCDACPWLGFEPDAADGESRAGERRRGASRGRSSAYGGA